MEHVPRAPANANISCLENLERDDRGVVQVPQFMREELEGLAPACRFAAGAGLLSFARVLGDRTRDGIVKALVQHAKVVGADGRVEFHGQLGDRLTDVAVIVHDL